MDADQNAGLTDRERANRVAWAAYLGFVICQCHPADASAIMAAALEDMQSSGPTTSLFGDLREDAARWAEYAPVHEVQAYIYAGLRQLQGAAMLPKARKRLFAAMWADMGVAERREFLERVTAK